MKINKQLSFILFLVMTLLVFKTHAQQDVVENSESVIIMSEDDIVSLALKLRELKKDYLNKKAIAKTGVTSLEKSTFEVEFLRNQVAQLENMLKNSSVPKEETTIVYKYNDQNQKELKEIKQEVNQLKNLINQLVANSKNEVTIAVSSAEFDTKKEVAPAESVNEELVEAKDVITKENLFLKNKLDSLTTLFKNYKETNYNVNFTALEKRITELQNELAAKNTVSSSYNQLVEKYKSYDKSIFFSNNSADVNKQGAEVITELYEILTKNNTIDIVVKGFASNKGVALYNENLSMMRTESVKKALISKGIHPVRVLTQYHGIDYKATDEIARRVEISILVRK